MAGGDVDMTESIASKPIAAPAPRPAGLAERVRLVAAPDNAS